MVVDVLASTATHLSAGASVVLADNNFGDDSPDATAGPLGLFIILALLAVVIFLIISMTKHLKRIPANFEQKPKKRARRSAAATGSGGGEQGAGHSTAGGPEMKPEDQRTGTTAMPSATASAKAATKSGRRQGSSNTSPGSTT